MHLVVRLCDTQDETNDWLPVYAPLCTRMLDAVGPLRQAFAPEGWGRNHVHVWLFLVNGRAAGPAVTPCITQPASAGVLLCDFFGRPGWMCLLCGSQLNGRAAGQVKVAAAAQPAFKTATAAAIHAATLAEQLCGTGSQCLLLRYMPAPALCCG